jgi:hypothetical protein
MVLCFVALFVFAFLGLFSLRYRRLAQEAFDCVFRTVTLRPCQSKLDERIKARLVSKLVSKRQPAIARFVNRYFALLSWIFVILTFVSMFFAVRGIYNFAAFGNCNGPAGGFCIYSNLAPPTPECAPKPCQDFGCACRSGDANCTSASKVLACSGACDCPASVCAA